MAVPPRPDFGRSSGSRTIPDDEGGRISSAMVRRNRDVGSAEPQAMHQLKSRFEVALYVWDYFYLSQRPAPGDEPAWAVIERATCRIRESEIHLEPSTPSDVRLRSARRVRIAVRTALRHIKLLSAEPEPWVLDGLVALESLADAAILAASPALD